MMLRAFRPEDAKGIVRLHSMAGECFEDMELSEEFIHSITTRPDFRIFIADEGGKLIGFSGVLFHPSLGRAEIGPIAVDEGKRKNGVGSILLEKVVSFLREAGVRRLSAKVKSDNPAARSFFESNGFVEEGFFRRYTKKGEDVLQYVRFL